MRIIWFAAPVRDSSVGTVEYHHGYYVHTLADLKPGHWDLAPIEIPEVADLPASIPMWAAGDEPAIISVPRDTFVAMLKPMVLWNSVQTVRYLRKLFDWSLPQARFFLDSL